MSGIHNPRPLRRRLALLISASTTMTRSPGQVHGHRDMVSVSHLGTWNW